MIKPNSRINLSVFDFSKTKIVDLYDSSNSQMEGAAFNINWKQEISGWKEISFDIPPTVNGLSNSKTEALINEYLVRQKIQTDTSVYEDWYYVEEPKLTMNSRKMDMTINCPHISAQLKTKNLYLEFDGDTSGIGTAQQLVQEALVATGWKVDADRSDTLLEKDGTKEKIRTFKSASRAGAYKLIEELGVLFDFYPIFEGSNQTVVIKSINNRDGMMELTLDKNLESLTRTLNSSNLVTKLYVDGEYGDDGYVGIDDVNPTGLSFLLNFDYYKSLGQFTNEHQAALDSFLTNIKALKDEGTNLRTLLETNNTRMFEIWGGLKAVIYKAVKNGDTFEQVEPMFLNGATESDIKYDTMRDGQDVVHNTEGDIYRYENPWTGNALSFSNGDDLYIHYVTAPSGLLGSAEIARLAKFKIIDNYWKEHNKASTTDKEKAEIEKLIKTAEDETQALWDKIQVFFREIMPLINANFNKGGYEEQVQANLKLQLEEEDKFAKAMGHMLREDCWSNPNYVIGQEKQLFEDAEALMEELGWPELKYNLNVVVLSHITGYEQEIFELGTTVRVWDKELNINDVLYVDTIDESLDDPSSTKISVTNETLRRQGKNLGSALNRMQTISEEVRRNNDMYRRGKNFDKYGNVNFEKLQGIMDVERNKIQSSLGRWGTDAQGNMQFESLSSDGAMMQTGEGFMIASTKDEDGNWIWRTFGTSQGFTADLINAGLIKSELIEAHSLTVDKLASDVGTGIDLTNNESQTLYAKHEDVGAAIEISETNIKSEIATVSTDLDGYKTTVATWQDFDEEGLEMGKSDSKFKMKLSNEKLSFLENDSEMAYFANNQMYINSAEIEQNWTIGNPTDGYYDFKVSGLGQTLKARKA